MSEPRVLICASCHKECTPATLAGEYYTSFCCDEDIMDQDGEMWSDEQLFIIAAERSEMDAENAAGEEAR